MDGWYNNPRIPELKAIHSAGWPFETDPGLKLKLNNRSMHPAGDFQIKEPVTVTIFQNPAIQNDVEPIGKIPIISSIPEVICRDQ